MRIIDRLMRYMVRHRITAYSFERKCLVANGYLKKKQKGKGAIGSDILQRIHLNYPDLNLVWLISGNGEMLLRESELQNLLQEEKQYYTKDEKIQLLNERIILLESQLADKKKIIELMEAKGNDRLKIKN